MATTLEGLIRSQKELGGRIERFLINTLKVGQEKLTLPLLRQRVELLGSYWREFSEQHRAIVRLADKPCEYLTNDTFDHIEACWVAFQVLGKPVREWDEWFLFLLSEKLDEETSMAWETNLTDPTATPTFGELEDFLESRAHAMVIARAREAAQAPKISKRKTNTAATKNVLTVKAAEPKGGAKVKSGKHCPLCSGNHVLSACKNFKDLPAVERHDLVLKKGFCLSCLATSHQVNQCTSKFRCGVCEGMHHTKLHDAYQKGENPNSTLPTSASYTVSAHKVTLLATATVILGAPGGRTLVVRALIDPGSESSFLSEWVAQSLNLRRRPVRVNLTGYQGIHVGTAQSEVHVTLRSLADGDFNLVLEALVTKTLTAPIPSQPISTGDWPHLHALPLADSQFAEPAKVDVLLGADVCGLLMLEQRTGPPGTPVAIRTPFEWTLIGPVALTGLTRNARVLHVSRHEPQPDLQRFWELEEVPNSSPMTPEERRCEELFIQTTRRDSSGRYVARLPFLGEDHPTTGRSRRAALQLLLNSERKRARDPDLHRQYQEFMDEYRRLGHMTAATVILQERDPGFYLPHHAVWKQDGARKKIRVVFNAAAATSSGRSLNDALLPGPKLQSDLWVVVTRWRLFRIAFSADIVKMFRQILVHPEDQDWLRILWRDDESMSVGDYRLTTVTYGTAPAPYLAHRVLRQLAEDEAHRFPLGAKALRFHSYVADILAGADDIVQAKEVSQQLVDILRSAGFPLDKWASMTTGIRTDEDSKIFREGDVHGPLGLQWDTRCDSLSVRDPRTTELSIVAVWTKRTVLSEVAKLFDPLGWLAPVIVRAKVIVQDLWLANVTWDEPIDPLLGRCWSDFRQELAQLSEISLPRWVHYSPELCKVEFHGFCDVSERAYAAAVYMLVRRPDATKVSLLMAKTRVAPTRKVVSIPPLELCGAVLLARLLLSVHEALSIPHATQYAWTDSTVALAWIQAHPSRWKPFVAHRVAEIQSLLPGVRWMHVSTQDNPADLPSRGITCDDLQRAKLWWEGPFWLSDPGANWPMNTPATTGEDSPGEERHVSVGVVQETGCPPCPILERFSTLTRLIRVSAYLRRFLHNCRRSAPRRSGPLTTVELREALHMATRVYQAHSFSEVFAALSRGKEVPSSSSLKMLSPILGDDGLLRVGGRLQHSALPEPRRCPAIIDRSSHLATLVIRDTHQKTLHGGLNATLSWIHRTFWIPRCRVQVKQVLRDCVTCTRLRGSTGRQQMGPLPPSRIQPARPFQRAGVDYAGPVQLRTTKGRGHKSQKGYLVVFVCLATKAVHLDVVSDLTSEAFLAAFHRFTARRGRCTHLLSDNGTTFRGADALLRQLFTASSRFFTEVTETLANDALWGIWPI
ncbi:uncharacterized protein LOC143217599 [Lasioglossum baleicum]|uniref:uncharacterized protein LOC143217599 n=1 Tax=Lasioglossum baleicum TaxID=434251 RepID=UPI003FCE1E88